LLNKLLWAILLILVGMIFPVAWIIIIPLLVLLIIAAILDTIITPIKGSSRQNFFVQEYYVSEDELFKLLIKTISNLGYKIEGTDKNSGLITFKTGTSINVISGQEGSVVIVQNSENTCEVRINMSYRGQLWDWGEGYKIANRILNELGEILPQVDDESKNNKELDETEKGLLKTWWNANKY